jgi:hypothetical protein
MVILSSIFNSCNLLKSSFLVKIPPKGKYIYFLFLLSTSNFICAYLPYPGDLDSIISTFDLDEIRQQSLLQVDLFSN